MIETLKEKKECWVAWINTDLTEGKGRQIPAHVCLSKTAALRLGRKINVQGCDADVKKDTLYRFKNQWYGPVELKHPSKEDEAGDRKIAEVKAIYDKALLLGLSHDDIQTLQQ